MSRAKLAGRIEDDLDVGAIHHSREFAEFEAAIQTHALESLGCGSKRRKAGPRGLLLSKHTHPAQVVREI